MIKNKIAQLSDLPSFHLFDIYNTPFDMYVSARLPAISYSGGYLCVTVQMHLELYIRYIVGTEFFIKCEATHMGGFFAGSHVMQLALSILYRQLANIPIKEQQ